MGELDDDAIDAGIYRAIWKVKPSLETMAMTPRTRFRELGLQSIEVLTVVFEIEEAFGVSIVDNQLDDFRTVAEARAVVARLLAAQRQP